MQNILIIGAGPAGLTAAYELLKSNPDRNVTILERTDRIGGISCTIDYKGNRIDIGGHRFFSKSDRVMDWWMERMPVQGKPSSDDKLLGREKSWSPDGPDPETIDRTLLIRDRLSRIFYLRKFFDYPISLKAETLFNLGLGRTLKAGIGYFSAQIFKNRNEESLEEFMVNHFGRPLYEMFFEDYTRKVWGKHPSEISADWGAQRIKTLSLSTVLSSAVKKLFSAKGHNDLRQKETDTSLIEQFLYPKLGPGQMWECLAGDIRAMGGTILMNHKVVDVALENGQVQRVTAESPAGKAVFACDGCISTMPVKDLVAAFSGTRVPAEIGKIAETLPYRDFMTVGLLVKKLKISNTTRTKTRNGLVPDTWMYIQERDVQLCRLQIFNNWSPYMVKDPETVWIGLEYMCSEHDKIWKIDDEKFTALAVDELCKTGIIERADVLDSCRFRIEKAYPAYFGGYLRFEEVRGYLDQIPNLFCIGRNGQHRYNNQDHSMLSAFEAVKCINEGNSDKTAVWEVNTEHDYHEHKTEPADGKK